jgi:hypothetical protein
MDYFAFKKYFLQFKLLLWKNWKLQSRSIIGTCLELLIPALFAIILLPIRTIVKSNPELNDIIYPNFGINYFDRVLFEKEIKENFTFKIGYHPNNSDIAKRIIHNTSRKLNLSAIGKVN